MGGTAAGLLIAGPAYCTDLDQPIRAIPCGPPVWSPDGTRVFAPSGPGTTVVVVSVDGSGGADSHPAQSGAELNPIGSTAWQRVAP